MKAIARLILVYLASRPLQRWVTSAALAALVSGIVGLLLFPAGSAAGWPILNRLQWRMGVALGVGRGDVGAGRRV